MVIVVCVKQVGVLGDEVEFSADGTSVDPDYLDPALNEWDAYAIEEALLLRDALGGEVVAISCGDTEVETVLRRALAMGADRAIRVEAAFDADALAPARALAEAVRAEQPGLVLCGSQSSDASYGATPSALAGLLGLPVVAVVRRIELESGGATALVHRELEGGVVDVVELDLPAVVSVQTGINEPRYVTLRAIRQADEQNVEIVTSTPASSTSVLRMHPPEGGSTATMLEGGPTEIARQIAELVKARVVA
jgi:electron transfer flavoprotein beta subunit